MSLAEIKEIVKVNERIGEKIDRLSYEIAQHKDYLDQSTNIDKIKKVEIKSALKAKQDLLGSLQVIADNQSKALTSAIHVYRSRTDNDSRVLTEKEIILLGIVCHEDRTLKQAAADVHISLDTANKRIASIKRKLNVSTMASVVRIFLQKYA